jgi:mono/diheme cytochrome c family protein
LLSLRPRHIISLILALAMTSFISVTFSFGQQPTFRNAPSSAADMKNPYSGNATAATAGKKLYAQDCAQCHGNNRQGMGPAPALDTASVHNAKPGELFWFISTGKIASGMPSWSNLPKQQRWQVVTFLQSQSNEKAAK